MQYMKTKLLIFSTILLFMVLNSCRDPEIDQIPDEGTTPKPEVFIEKEVAGLILDTKNSPVVGALISTPKQNLFLSDERGFYKFKELISSDKFLIKSTHRDYFPAYGHLSVPEKGNFILNFNQERLSSNFTFSAKEDREFDLGEVHFKIKANSFLDVNGQAYSGQVVVYAKVYDAVDPKTFRAVPAGLPAINAKKEWEALQHLAMASVLFKTSSGQALSLSQEATISLEPSATFRNRTWLPKAYSLNEQKSVWEYQSDAKSISTSYEFSSKELTMLSLAIPASGVQIQGSITVSDFKYSVNAKLVDEQNGFVYDLRTNKIGQYQMYIPKNTKFKLIAADVCGANSEVMFGTIVNSNSVAPVINFAAKNNLATCNAKLVNCSFEPARNAYAIFYSPNKEFITVMSSDSVGAISGTLDFCSSPNLFYDVYDLATGESIKNNKLNAGNVNELGQVYVCVPNAANQMTIYYDNNKRIIDQVSIEYNVGTGAESYKITGIDATPAKGDSVIYQFAFAKLSGSSTYISAQTRPIVIGNPVFALESFNCGEVEPIQEGKNSNEQVEFNFKSCTLVDAKNGKTYQGYFHIKGKLK